ncbi:acetate--CoA ligase family protein [Amycolatopsis suaedae]|uniref:CoA-binding protein n=1 Tax=Amycolatopsis suaedae TaxID=2510978 RepID=A0A4Q7J595_9PSEU|nr:acetate--CoA ligase family protein [Amycolatopsis suaedae]RZQ62008.1 CoA-binding protein [Amycolatopsis suaedae]
MSEVFGDPASVAVVGASADPAKWGHWLARGALEGSGRRRVHLVNSRGGEVLGHQVYRRLGELPEVPELVVLAVPATAVHDVAGEALTLGTRGLLVITAGVPDPAGLAARVRAAGARLVGPSCLGLYDAQSRLELAWGRFQPGPLGIVSQSGQVGLELAGLAAAAGVGVSRFVSVGGQADVTLGEMVEGLASHEATRAVVVYAEGFGDGRRLVHTLRRLTEAGKPVVVLTVGASAAGSAAARSHTGALTSTVDVVDAACRAAGAVRVTTPAEAVDVARFLLEAPAAVGDRLAIVGDSGGQGAIGADVAVRAGLRVPRAPVDLDGAGEKDLTSYARAVGALLRDGEADAVLLTGYFGSYGTDTPELGELELAVADDIGAVVAETGVPVVVHSMGPAGSPAVRALRARGVPVYGTVDAALSALAAAVRLAAGRGAVPPPVPEPRRPLPGGGYLAARELVASAGVRFPAGVAVTGPADVHPRVTGLRAPYVVKAEWLPHKSDVGGVAVGLADGGAVAEALAGMIARLGPGRYVVEEQDVRPDAVEILVGARWDAAFGPVVLVGAGGTEAELYRDTTVELGPVDTRQALAMLRRLRCYPLLDGWRGRAPLDLVALADTVSAVSWALVDSGAGEIELNPVRVGADGVVAVDALVTGGAGWA